MFLFQASAQEGTMYGVIKQKDGKAIIFATVSLSYQKKIIHTSTSDSYGRFKISGLQKDTTYILEVSYVGYNTSTLKLTPSLDPITVTLHKNPNVLKEVIIVGTKPLIERKFGKLIFNVENSVIANGGSIWNALTKVPGVRANFDGNVSANNKATIIYLNDKPVRLSGEDLSNYLKNLSASNVANIEVISNPSARYDAQGGAVINIISKKTSIDGLNATLNSGINQGAFPSFNAGGNFNYRQGKINIYGNYNYNYNKRQRNEDELFFFQV